MNQLRAEPALRLGPRPLGLHLLTAIGGLMSCRAALPLWKSSSGPLTKTAAGNNLRQELDGLADKDLGSLLGAVDLEVRRRLDAFHRGVVAYRRHPYRRNLPEPTVGWRRGTTRVLDFGGEGRPVLFVPSLINRAYILDLSADTSLLRWLRESGFRPLLVDWGSPGTEERSFDLTDYIRRRLVPALSWASGLGGGPVAVVGYCMGGLLAVAAAQMAPANLAGLALLATPWDFQAASPQQALLLATFARLWDPTSRAMGVLPVDAIQALFWCLDPFAVQQKFIRFANMEPSSAQAKTFVGLEDWLNDGVPLVEAVARECLMGWYGANTPARLRWRVAGEPINPGDIRCPALVVVAETDRIVPPESARALVSALNSPDVLNSPLGHIGMIVGMGAKSAVWGPVADWLAAL